MKTTGKLLQLTLILYLVSSSVSSARQQSRGATGGKDPCRYLYFFGASGEFLKWDTSESLSLEHWYLSRTEGVSDLLPGYVPRGVISGMWVPFTSAYNPTFGRLYIVFPLRPEDEANSRLIAFQLPYYTVLKTLDFISRPSVVVSDDGRLLFVSYRNRDEERKANNTIMDVNAKVYETIAFKEIGSYHESVNAQDYMSSKASVNCLFSQDAYFEQGHIIDGLSDIKFVNGQPIKERVWPGVFLSESQAKQAARFDQLGNESEKAKWYFNVTSSAKGRTAAVLMDWKLGRTMFIMVDMIKRAILCTIETPPGRGRLSPDGESLIVEEIEQRGPGKEMYKTGRLMVYSASDGQKKADVTYPEYMGLDSQNVILMMKPDASTIYYLAQSKSTKLFSADITEKYRPKAMSIDFMLTSDVKCFCAGW